MAALSKSKFVFYIIGLFLAILAVGAVFSYRNFRGIGPAINKPKSDITTAINTTGMPLTLPKGFGIEILAKDLPGARVMKLDEAGSLWVSSTSAGKVTHFILKDGKVTDRQDVFTGLKQPHGLAFDPNDSTVIYIAETNKLSRAKTDGTGLTKLVDLPSGGGHFTRTIEFGSDGRLYVSVGSSCNVCTEADARRAAIWSLNPDGSDFKSFAKGLRNSVFFALSPIDGKMWATDNGRDLLGDDIPPDEINVVEEGKDYGWPYCYGDKVVDPFGRSASRCAGTTGSHIDLQAHSAALGLAFVDQEGWPTEYQRDLLVAFHGSWNRSVPTGYKIVRIKLGENGKYESTEDFITGWLKDGNALGRPVDLLVAKDGVLYVSDDKAGVIYRVKYTP